MFASTMQLAQKGKITHKNAFQLQLIDHMADIIQQQDEADTATAGQTPLKAKKQHTSATGTPLSTAIALATPAERAPAPTPSLASPNSVLAPVSGQPVSLSDITNKPQQPGARSQVNFVKASSTLDASVMIYSGRVDNVHKDAYRMAGGLTAQQLEREEDVEEAEQDESEKANRARKKRRSAATIETKLANINMKQVERREDGDPFFKRMSAAFDAGGAKGMLTHQLSVYRGAEVALDGQLQVMDSRRGEAEEGLTQHFDLAELSELLHKTASNWRQLSACPLMRELEAVRNELEGKPAQTEDDIGAPESGKEAAPQYGEAYYATDGDDELNASFGGMDLSDCGSGVAVGVDLNELHAEIDAAIAQEQCLDSQMAGAMNDEDDDTVATSANISPAATASSTTFSYLAPGLFGAPTADQPSAPFSHHSQVAGMTHWKFKAAAAAPATTTQRQPRQTKTTVPIDFFAAPKPASLFALVPNKRLKTLRLSTATLRKRMEPSARAALMRPAAATYRVEGLMRLYGQDSSVSIRATVDERAEEADGAAVEAGGAGYAWDDMADGEDDDGAAATFDTVGAPLSASAAHNSQSDFTLLAKPKQVEQQFIGYAQAAKRVDVKKLKDCLWTGISSANHAQKNQHNGTGEDNEHSDDWEEAGNDAAVPPITFQHAIDTLAGRYPAGQLASVSVPYCFICVLHLCNEQGLVLESDPLPPSNTAAGEDTNERIIDLSSFTIKAAR